MLKLSRRIKEATGAHHQEDAALEELEEAPEYDPVRGQLTPMQYSI